jgi:hypothetical protein
MPSALSIDVNKTHAILIGMSEFPEDPINLPPLPAVKNNVRDLAKALCDESIVGIPRTNVVQIVDVPKASDVLTRLVQTCRKAVDTLIFYYAGHGLVGRKSSQLYLATKETTEEDAEFNAMPFEKIRSAIAESSATKKILIVDSCFSGRIMSDSMSSAPSLFRANLEMEGTYSIASGPANQPAMAPSGEKYTLFTGEMIRLLNEGLDNKKDVINLKEFFEHIRDNLKKLPDVPEPQSFNIQNADKIILARNRKFVPAMEPSTEPVKSAAGLPQKKQLNGIVKILFQCHKLLDNSIKAGGNIWFAGLTSAFGPVHNIPRIRTEWLKKNPGEVGLDKVSEEFNGNLLAMMAGAGYSSKIVIVTLKKELVKSRFIDPLYAHETYKLYAKRNKRHMDVVLDEIEKFQEKVEKAASIQGHTIAYVEEMPIQAIVTQIRGDDGVVKTACVVIEVGTQNVGSGPATGFYSENPEDCEKAKEYVENLYNSAYREKEPEPEEVSEGEEEAEPEEVSEGEKEPELEEVSEGEEEAEPEEVSEGEKETEPEEV